MKKVFMLVAAVAVTLVMAAPSYAFLNGGDTTNNKGGNGYGGAGGDSSSLAAAGAVAGACSDSSALALGVMGQKSDVANAVNIEGNEKLSTLAYSHGASNPTQNQDVTTLGILSVSVSNLTETSKIESRIDLSKKAGIELDKEVLKEDILRATKPVKFLFVKKVSGRKHLLNLFGLLLT